MMQDRASESTTGKLVLLAFLGVGAALMIGGGISAGETAGFVLGASKATGRVARHDVIRSDDGIGYYYPVIEFENARGERVEFRSKDRSSSQPYRIGHPIQVLYDARDPHHAAIDSFGSLWGDPGMLFLMGLGFAGLAGVVLIASPEQDRGAPTGKGRGKRAAGRPPASGRGPTAWDRGRPGSTGGHLILLAFFIVGLGLTIGGASWAWVTNDFIAGAARATGRVVGYETARSREGRLSRFLIVGFEAADGEEVEFRSGIDASSRPNEVGDPVQVLYDPRNPYRAYIKAFDSLWLGPMILLLLGLFLAGLSSFILVISRGGDRRVRAAERLREETARRLRSRGRRLRTRVDQVAPALGSDGTGRHPYKIVSQWHDPGTDEVHVFESEPIWFDPRAYLPEMVFVYVDPEDPKVYHMDTSFLPRRA
jgi:hypothetical protein